MTSTASFDRTAHPRLTIVCQVKSRFLHLMRMALNFGLNTMSRPTSLLPGRERDGWANQLSHIPSTTTGARTAPSVKRRSLSEPRRVHDMRRQGRCSAPPGASMKRCSNAPHRLFELPPCHLGYHHVRRQRLPDNAQLVLASPSAPALNATRMSNRSLTLRLEPSGAAIAHDDLGCYSTKASTSTPATSPNPGGTRLTLTQLK